MLWRNRRESGNVIDRRGMGKTVGIGGLLVGAVFYYLMGGNPIDYLAMNAGNVQPQRQESAGESDEKKFASVVLADTGRHVVGNFPQEREDLYSTEDGSLFRNGPVGLRKRFECDRTILLPG